MTDERDELLERIEAIVFNADASPCSMTCNPSEDMDELAKLFEKARARGVVKYPRP